MKFAIVYCHGIIRIVINLKSVISSQLETNKLKVQLFKDLFNLDVAVPLHADN